MWDYADWSKETKANGGPAEFADKLYQTGFQDGTIEGFSSGQRSTLGAIGIIGGACFICGGLVVSRLKIWADRHKEKKHTSNEIIDAKRQFIQALEINESEIQQNDFPTEQDVSNTPTNEE